MMIKIYQLEEAKKDLLKRNPIYQDSYSPATLARTESVFGEGVMPHQAVMQILQSIDEDGDKAVQKWNATLDRFDEPNFKIGKDELAAAYERISARLQEVLEKSATRIRDFHERQPVTSWLTNEMGGEIGQRFTAIERVGIYVPGGTAPLPSSLLMSVIPAQVAGVKDVVVCPPPNPHDSILAAAYICGVDEICQVGGAQAIAAMAFGTETLPRVDKIVGAGNLFVTLAKQQLYGLVGFDGLAGPTETMVIADEEANPAWVAADLLAQAEHDVQASAILLTTSADFAKKVQAAVTEQTAKLSRAEIIEESLENKGGIVVIPTLEEASKLANDYAAEHLCLAVRDPKALMDKINNAGGFFLGEHSFEALGDYVAGPSHVMPTGGTARFASPLNLLDFVKVSSVVALDPETAAALSPIAADFADTEKLAAHANASKIRMMNA
ncbi:MAG: histidinol dehydrogenase [Anaerolineae bacterium]|nr:histidinol dehydrogenase [Anaerolineae bacterium]